MSAPSVKLPRPLYGPQDPRHSTPGKDVVALARGLSRAGFLKWGNFSPGYGAVKVAAVKRLQKAHGIPQSGQVGERTFDALRRSRRKGHPDEWAFDSTAVKLLREAYDDLHVSPEDKARQAGVAAAAYWIVHRDEEHYAQIRPLPPLKPPKLVRYGDCSIFVIDVFYAAGSPDPTGRGYDGQGYTGSLVGKGRLVPVSALMPLDLVFYGFTRTASPAFPIGSPTHVAVYIGGGYVASFGSESGPEKRTVGYRTIHSARRYELA